MYKQILVPIDGSDTATQGLNEAIKLARQSGASIRLVHVVSEAGIKVDKVLVDAIGSQSGAAIVEQAEKWPADLIVCGTHGRRGIRRLVMGSDAEYVVRHTPVPVLLIRSQERKRT